MKKIVTVGSGYVGLVTGACLADMGNHVTCLDTDREKVDSLIAGNPPFYEPGLNELVERCVESGRLKFTTSYESAIPGADICFLALPTPSNEDGSCDVGCVLKATEAIANTMDNFLIVANKSTVPVGTTEKVRAKIEETLREREVEIPYAVVSNPEFLREGTAVHDSHHPERIVLGVDHPKALQVMSELYAPMLEGTCELLVMDIPSAELSKYAANAMLASRLSFMNAMASLCERVGGNIQAVESAIGADKRIGRKYLRAGLGFGGSCLPKDLRALKATFEKSGIPADLLQSIIRVNEHQNRAFFEKILDHFTDLHGKVIAVWGLSFKPDTDDLREAPSLTLIRRLLDAGASLRLYDPVACRQAKLLFPEAHFCNDEYEAADGADAVVLVTEWMQFKRVDFEKIGTTMREKALFDGRNLYSGEAMEKLGYTYYGIGVSKPTLPALAL